MSTAFSEILEKYGDPVTLYFDGSSTDTTGFVQPVLSRHIKETWSTMTELGESDTSRFYGFFPGDLSMEGCLYIDCGDVEYDIIRAEPYKVMGTVSHWEALMRKREEEYVGTE